MSLAKTFGHISGFPPGSTFKSRDALLRAGVHGHIQGGIYGSAEEGAYSICLSAGYEDNEDNGERVTYVGSGGQDREGNQIADQSIDDPPNKSLYISSQTKRPIRVTRGKNGSSYYAPASGYRYDGLYIVDSAEMKRGKQGYMMCFFYLRRIREEGDRPLPTRRLLTQKKMSNMLRLGGRRR